MPTLDEQLHIILSGQANVVPLDALKTKLALGRPLRIKLGVDPTAPDLHLGHGVVLNKLRHFQDLGHQVVLIIGDGTALIGDPSGRNTTRPPLTEAQISVNAKTYAEQAFKILDKDKTELRWNGDWLTPLTLSEILKLASQFTVARILERDDFANRLTNQQTVSLHELLYPVMQAYDSVQVEADVEIGGTDQLFNLLAGRELMEKLGMEPQVCLTLPLLEGTDGKQKMSKSYGNHIGISEPPGEIFGKVMSIPDELMERYFYLASGYPVAESDKLLANLKSGELHPNLAKRLLAKNIVSTYYSEADAELAEQEFDHIFKDKEIPDDISEYKLEIIAGDDGLIYLPGVMVELELAASSGEARRLIDNGGVKINGEQLPAKQYKVQPQNIQNAVIAVGKRKYARLV